jgi:thiol-disulfide isomerase/thioredoxin
MVRSESDANHKSRPSLGAWLLLVILTTPLAIGVHAFFVDKTDRTVEGPLEFTLHAAPPRLPVVAFNDDKGRPTTLDAFRGRTVLLHLWATSVPPSEQPLPSLDRLRQRLNGERFEVVALSLDTGDQAKEKIASWYVSAGIRHLKIFHDPTMFAARRLSSKQLPTTLLLDAQGRELGRTSAVLRWDSPAAIAFIQEQFTSSR